jgi:hypothetical protein
VFTASFSGACLPSSASRVFSRLSRGRPTLFTCALLIAACAVVFVPRASANTDKTVGPRISVFGDATQTFPAGQPFHFSHGWQSQPSGDHAIGNWRFSLTVDGVEVKPDFIETIRSDDPVLGTLLFRPYVFNFPDGLTGSHVFGGTFVGPCQDMVAAGPCRHPNEIVPLTGSPFTITVTFTP